MKERDQGLIEGPFTSLVEMDHNMPTVHNPQAIRLMNRFAVHQTDKYRNIDDAKASCHSDATFLHETITTVVLVPALLPQADEANEDEYHHYTVPEAAQQQAHQQPQVRGAAPATAGAKKRKRSNGSPRTATAIFRTMAPRRSLTSASPSTSRWTASSTATARSTST